MLARTLHPAAPHVRHFGYDALRHIPPQPGCYALCAATGDVLYVGRAVSLRARLQQHLARRLQLAHPTLGFAHAVHFILAPSAQLAACERGWMNLAVLADGALPPWNVVYATA